MKNFFRKLRTYLSINFHVKLSDDNKDLYLYNKLNYYYKVLNKNQNNSKKKTHLILINKISNLIKKKQLSNFLRDLYLQKIFFIHNRFFLFVYLLNFIFCKKWNFWKKLLTENNIGNPLRFFFFKFTSGNKIFQTFHIKFFANVINKSLTDFDFILEFGGGYGNMAQTFNKINKNTKYVIFDLLEVNLLQYYYLKKNGINVSINKDNKSNVILVNSLIALKKLLLKYQSKKNSLLIANWSISETPLKFRSKFSFIYDFFYYQFIAYQKNFEGIDNVTYFKKSVIDNYKNKIFITKKCLLLANSFYLISTPSKRIN